MIDNNAVTQLLVETRDTALIGLHTNKCKQDAVLS